jgi:hypothetical protein
MDEYQQAIQNPALAFQDADLRTCRTDTDPMGWPRVSSGGFALSYRLLGRDKQWAVRCFHKYVPDRQRRYAAISRFLNSSPSLIFTPIDYLADGIQVNGRWFPITKMRWLPGETLHKFVERNITNRQALGRLPGQFQDLVAALECMGIAHGDLQHGNIMVSNGKLILIDYDGMYVPELAGLSSSELGHVNYQHPARTEKEFGLHLDRFSSIVIYLALHALTVAPHLWHKYSAGGENLLFKQEDFLSPDTAGLLAELGAVPELRPLVKRFRIVCKSDLAQVPRLVDFLAGQMSAVVPAPWVPAPLRQQYPVIAANQRDRLLGSIGQRVVVIGRITDYKLGMTKYDKPYAFLNFGDWRTGCFTLVIWSEGLQLFEAQQKSPADYTGKWVSVTGLLTKYSPGWSLERPQIVVEMPSEIEILAGGEAEAKERLLQKLQVAEVPEVVEERVQIAGLEQKRGQEKGKPNKGAREDKPRRYFGMTVVQIGILIALGLAACFVGSVAIYMLFGS